MNQESELLKPEFEILAGDESEIETDKNILIPGKKEIPQKNKKIEILPGITKEFQAAREAILGVFPENKIEGINVARVRQFFEDEGLITKDFIVIGKSDVAMVEKIITEKTGFGINLKDGDLHGKDLTGLDIAVVFRDCEKEKLNGAILTEGVLVHELFHLAENCGKQLFIDKKNELKAMKERRLGFSLPYLGVGSFFEEGAADMFRAKYFKKFANKSELQKISAVFWDINQFQPDDTFFLPYREGIFPLPMKYCSVAMDNEGKPQILATKSAIAGYAMELLCQANPELENIIKKACNSIDGLREFRKAVDMINPGIYQKLFQLGCGEDEFMNGLDIVIDNTKGGMGNVIVADGNLKIAWDELLKKIPKREVKKEINSGLRTGVYTGGFYVGGEEDKKNQFLTCCHGRNVAPIFWVGGKRGRMAYGITSEQAMDRFRRGKYGRNFTLEDLGIK
jgi:hypothetical protein